METLTKLELLAIYLLSGIILGIPFIVFDFSQETCPSSDDTSSPLGDIGHQFTNLNSALSENLITQKLYEIIDKLQHGVLSYTAELQGDEINGTVVDLDSATQDNHTASVITNATDSNTCQISDIEKYSPLLFNEENIRRNVNEWLLENGQASLYNRVRLTRAGYANDWVQLFSACLVFTTYGVLWEGHSFHGWAQFYFVSLELLQRSVNILQTTAFHWDKASVLLSHFDPYYLKYCSLVDLFCYYVPLSQLFCLTALTYDVWRTFGKDQLIADSRNDKKYVNFTLVGVLIPAIYTSFGFLLHYLTDRYLCHPSFETVSDILIYLVYRYTPSGVLILINFILIRRTQHSTARVEDECRVVRKQCSNADSKPIQRLNLYLKLLWILCILTLLLKPFSRTMMAFGVHLEQYDGGYSNMALYILSRTHSVILLFVLLNHPPTRVSLERLERSLSGSLNGKAKDAEELGCLAQFGSGMKLAVVQILLLLCNICSGRLCMVSWKKMVKKKQVLTEEYSTSSA